LQFATDVFSEQVHFLDVYTDMAFFLPDEHIQSFDEPASCLHTANLPLISTASRLLPSILRSALTDNRLFCPVTTTF
jgi:hypothetical protein